MCVLDSASVADAIIPLTDAGHAKQSDLESEDESEEDGRDEG